MKFNVSISDRKTYVNIQVSKPVTADLLGDFIREASEKAKKYGIDNFLFDLRRAPNRTAAFDHYEFIYRQSKQLGFAPASKHALVVRPEDKDDYSFVETVLKNAGYQGRMFTDKSVAIEWLEK